MRLRSVLVVLVLAVGGPACSGDDDGGVVAGTSTTVADQPVVTVPGAPTTAPDGEPATPDGGPGGSPEPGQPSPEGGAGGGQVTPTTDGGPGEGGGGGDDAPALDEGGPPGSFGAELLGARTGSRLVVEVLAQDGAEPASSTLDHLVAVAGDASGKQVTVEAGSVPGEGRTWTGDDLRAAAADATGVEQGGGTVAMRLLLLHGSFEEGDGTLGVAVGGAVAALFVDRIEESATLGMGATRLEQAVATHELGHLFGLVDLLLDTGRADPEHPGHSPSQGSVMYWAVESDLVGQVLTGGPPVDFDDDDRADLDRIRRMGS